jgi:hypothetical protein
MADRAAARPAATAANAQEERGGKARSAAEQSSLSY